MASALPLHPDGLSLAKSERDLSMKHKDNNDVAQIDKLVEEFKEAYRKQGKYNRKIQVPYLTKLAEHYEEKAENSGDWVNLLKAHSLYNSCSARESGDKNQDVWKKYAAEAFEVQQKYWGNEVAAVLELQQQIEITLQLKTELNKIRVWLNDELKEMDQMAEEFTCEPGKLESPTNHALATDWIEKMKCLSSSCNAKMMEFIEGVINYAEFICGKRPCGFCAVAMGSAAKEEATPYSDLEFLFLVSEKTEAIEHYFERLAITIYFLIGNLGETNLKYMNIAELRDRRWFEDTSISGLKIDGLLPNAGNIPTGNGTSEQRNQFIVTVENLRDRFIDVYDNPVEDESVCGDLSAMLAFTKFITGSQNLLDKFNESIARVLPNRERKEISKKMLTNDMEKFDFQLSENSVRLIDLKTAIYRYPSLLIHDLKVIKCLEGSTSWDVIDKLEQKNTFPGGEAFSLRFALSIAQYVRLSAYNKHSSQVNRISVLPLSDRPCTEKSPWHFPRSLLILYMHHLVTVKSSLVQELQKHKDSIIAARLEETLFIASIHYYCNDFEQFLRTAESHFHEKFKDLHPSLQRMHLKALINCSRYKDAQSLIDATFTEEEKGNVWTQERLLSWKASIYAAKKRRYSNALSCHKERLCLLQGIYGSNDHTSIATCYDDIAGTCYFLGQYAEALENSQKSCAMKERLHSDQPYSAELHISYSRAAAAFDKLGKHKEACENSEKCLKHSIAALSAGKTLSVHDSVSHPNIADACRTYAMVQKRLGNYLAALEYMEVCFRMRLDVYGDVNHPDIAQSCHDLGRIHMSLGDREIALDYYEKSLATYREVYPNMEHPSIANVYCSLGTLHSYRKDYDQAETYLAESLRIRKTIYGDEFHPHVAISYDVFGHLYEFGGNYAKALEAYAQGLAIKQRFVKDALHPRILYSQHRIATVHEKQKDYDIALNLFQNCLEKSKMVTSYYRYRSTGRYYLDMGSVYEKKGQCDQALECYENCLKLNTPVAAGGAHPSIVQAFSDIGRLYQSLGKHAKALENYCDALEAALDVYGDRPNSSVAASYLDVGGAYEANADIKKAHEYYHKCLETRLKLHGDRPHPDVAWTYNSIGRLFQKQGKLDTALECYKNSLKMNVELYRDIPHQQLAASYFEIGSVYEAQSDTEKALEHYNKCLDINLKLYGDDTHPDVVKICKLIGEVHHN